MKTSLAAVFSILVLLAPVMPAQDGASSRRDIAELAQGFAEASKQMSPSRTVVFYRVDGRTRKISDIQEIRAVSGTLVIRISGGDRIAISAAAVIFVTDSKLEP